MIMVLSGSEAEPAESAREVARRSFLEQSAITLGQTWAERCRRDLRREGRPVAGGWPGTLREARIEVAQSILVEIARRRMPAVTETEREFVCRTTYASARAEWRRGAEPEAP